MTLAQSAVSLCAASCGEEIARGCEIFKNQIFVCKQLNKPEDITFLVLTHSQRKSLHFQAFQALEPLAPAIFSSPANCSYRCTSIDTPGLAVLQTKSLSDPLTAPESSFFDRLIGRGLIPTGNFPPKVESSNLAASHRHQLCRDGRLVETELLPGLHSCHC